MQLLFGIGALWGVRTDIPGTGPSQFAILQDNSIDFSFDLKELYSQLQFPVDVARAKGKITGKAKVARVFAALYANLFFGGTVQGGETNVSQSQIYSLTTSLATAGATFVADLGVYYNAIGNVALNYTAGAPTVAGSYTVNPASGVYTFSTFDIGQSVAISYVFTDAFGKTITISNNFMGYTPTFQGTFYTERATQGTSGQLTLRLNACVSNKLSFPSRIDDYNIPDFDYQAFSTASNSIGTLSTTE